MSSDRPETILIGAGPTALSALESLLEVCSVAAVFRDASQDDPVAALARRAGVPLIRDMSPLAIETAIGSLRPQCAVISSYHRIAGPGLLNLCPFINVHYSPLPQYRGRANVNWAIINNEPFAAVSIHTVVPGLDAGNILFQQPVALDDRVTVTGLYEQLNGIQREHLGKTVCAFLNGFAGSPQPEAGATYGCTRIPSDGEVDWSLATNRVFSLIRALQPPYPYAYTYFGCRRLDIIRAEPVEGAPNYVGRIPGRVVLSDRASGHVDVLTGDGLLRLWEVAFEDEAPRPAAAVIRSTKDSLGLHARDLLLKIRQLERQIDRLVSQPDSVAQTEATEIHL